MKDEPEQCVFNIRLRAKTGCNVTRRQGGWRAEANEKSHGEVGPHATAEDLKSENSDHREGRQFRGGRVVRGRREES